MRVSKGFAVALALIALAASATASMVVTSHDIYMDGTSIKSIFAAISEGFPKKSSDGAALCEAVMYDRVRSGEAFSVSHRFDNVADGDTVTMYFSVPDGYDRQVTIVAVEVASTGKGAIDVYRYPDVITAGTQLTPVNLNFSSSETSGVVVGYGYTVDLSNAVKVHETVLPGGTKRFAIGAMAEVGERVFLPPDNSFIVVVENRAGAAADISIRIIWYEEPVAG